MADLKSQEGEPHGAGSVAPRIDPLYLELMRYRVLRSMRSTLWMAFGGLLAVSLSAIYYIYHLVDSAHVEHVHLVDSALVERVQRLERLETNAEAVNRVVSVLSRDKKTDANYAEMLSRVGDPFVVGMETEFDNVERLTIVGTAFGPDAGQVELFYQNGSGGARSVTIILKEDRIKEWTNGRIKVTTTLEQQRTIQEQLQVQDFSAVVPYVRVTTAEGRSSPIW